MEDKMDIEDARLMGESLIEQHNLKSWSFKLNNAKRRLGQCDFYKREISVSKEFAQLNDKKRVMNTILHEIAHALVGYKHKHNIVWKEKAKSIGCDG